jgi:hypothetical protein
MPNEALITQIENLLAEIVELGGDNERSQIVPNLTVQDASPTNLDGWLIVSDDRDGDNILARKVGSVVYSDNDLVNVMFLRGTEPIAFQQGSESANNGIWEIVPSTSTDIFYDKGDVGIGKSVVPDATLEILDTTQAQLRLTFEEDVKFVDLTLDTNHDLTIKPSSTGQVKLQPTTDSTDFFQVLDADGGTPVLNVDSTNERIGVQTATPTALVEVAGSTNAQDAIKISTELTSGAASMLGMSVSNFTTQNNAAGSFYGLNANPSFRGTGGAQTTIFGMVMAPQIHSTATSSVTQIFGSFYRIDNQSGTTTLTNAYTLYCANPGGAGTITNVYGLYIADMTRGATLNYAIYSAGSVSSYHGGDIGVGVTNPQGRIHTYDTVSGFLLWEYDGLDATVREIIPNGTGDVLYRLHASYVLRDSAAAVASGTTDVSNAASVNLTVGGNTVRLRVNANGSTDIARTAGTDTIKVALTLRWL